MYLRETRRRNRDGSVVRYLQLAHNERHPDTGVPAAHVIHNFGRADTIDRAALERLMKSIGRVLDPIQPEATVTGDVAVVDARPLGGAFLLDMLWRRLRIDATMREMLTGRKLDARVERVLFALVANRALEPLSKLAGADWVRHRVAIDGLADVDEDSCYRAMDWLLEIETPLAKAVYWSVADLLDLEVDLLFFDTTSTYFESDGDDGEEGGAKVVGFRTFGHSKDSRPDLPQVVIGMAVTRTGIPIRVWTWPGNTNDQELIRQVKRDLADWKLSRVVWVADRGFSSAENRRYLQRAGGHYILGEKLRGESKEAAAALARPGRYRTVAGNLRVKEVVVDDGTMRDRFVVCHNPEQEVRDRTVRVAMVTQLERIIADTDALPAGEREERACRLHEKPALRKWLRLTAGGKLRIDQAKLREDERYDGKFLLRTSDPTLSAEDVALGYKQLLEVERGWRDMKSTLDLRPVFHRKEERIRAHVLLCWLGLLLIRLAETGTGETWRTIRHEMDRMHLVTRRSEAGEIAERTVTTAGQQRILAALGMAEPPRYSAFRPLPG